MVYNGYYKVMSNIPKMGQLPTPVELIEWDLTMKLVKLVDWTIKRWDLKMNSGDLAWFSHI